MGGVIHIHIQLCDYHDERKPPRSVDTITIQHKQWLSTVALCAACVWLDANEGFAIEQDTMNRD